MTLKNYGGALPGGLSARSYYVVNATSTTIQLEESIGGGAVDIGRLRVVVELDAVQRPHRLQPMGQRPVLAQARGHRLPLRRVVRIHERRRIHEADVARQLPIHALLDEHAAEHAAHVAVARAERLLREVMADTKAEASAAKAQRESKSLIEFCESESAMGELFARSVEITDDRAGLRQVGRLHRPSGPRRPIGPEDLDPHAVTGDNGMMVTEWAPYGVIGSISPTTNPTSTIINNAIAMVSAGNAVVSTQASSSSSSDSPSSKASAAVR